MSSDDELCTPPSSPKQPSTSPVPTGEFWIMNHFEKWNFESEFYFKFCWNLFYNRELFHVFQSVVGTVACRFGEICLSASDVSACSNVRNIIVTSRTSSSRMSSTSARLVVGNRWLFPRTVLHSVGWLAKFIFQQLPVIAIWPRSSPTTLNTWEWP